MKRSKKMKEIWEKTNYVLLGLLMLIPGLLKTFVIGPETISSMLNGIFLFSWAPVFWTWILILGEITFGLAILFKWQEKYASYGAVLILSIATLFVTINWSNLMSTNWSVLILHLVAITDYLILAHKK
jgi:uncharacterized membrane protein YphA (DoxX/SURF4 family)